MPVEKPKKEMFYWQYKATHSNFKNNRTATALGKHSLYNSIFSRKYVTTYKRKQHLAYCIVFYGYISKMFLNVCTLPISLKYWSWAHLSHNKNPIHYCIYLFLGKKSTAY